MALVPFRVNGPAAAHVCEERLVQLPHGVCLLVLQQPRASGALPHQRAPGASPPAAAGSEQQEEGGPRPELANVGLIVWQSSILLADLLLRRPPFGPASWPGLAVLELGAGPGVVGMALSLAGARVVLSDLPNVTSLTRANVAANCGHAARGPPPVVDHAWGSDPGPLLAALPLDAPQAAAAVTAAGRGAGGAGGQEAPAPEAAMAAAAGSRDAGSGDTTPGGGLSAGPCPAGPCPAGPGQPPGFDVVVGADLLYQPCFFGDLLASLGALAAPHALVLLAQRARGLGEAEFPAAAEAAGWAVERLPPGLLHEEFQDGTYSVLRLARL